MKRLFLPASLCVTALFVAAACVHEPPRRTQVTTVEEEPTDGGFRPKQKRKVEQVNREPDTGSTAASEPVVTSDPATSVEPTPPPAPMGDYQYGKAVPGKPGFVTSPYAPAQGYVDVRGYPPGTEVKDPYTGKIFLVP